MLNSFKKGLMIGTGITIPLGILLFAFNMVMASSSTQIDIAPEPVAAFSMPADETRYIEEYKDGKVVSRVPYVVTGEQILQERWTSAINAGLENATNTVENWQTANQAQKIEAIRFILQYALLELKSK